MIRGSDRAVNERTFLAWVRTGIAEIALSPKLIGPTPPVREDARPATPCKLVLRRVVQNIAMETETARDEAYPKKCIILVRPR